MNNISTVTIPLEEYETMKKELEILRQNKIFSICYSHPIPNYQAYNSKEEIIEKINKDYLEKINKESEYFKQSMEKYKREKDKKFEQSDKNMDNWKIIGFKVKK